MANELEANSIKDQIFDVLIRRKHGASTRFICNALFMEYLGGHRVIPGKDKMAYTRRLLVQLTKEGRVINDFKSHWIAKV